MKEQVKSFLGLGLFLALSFIPADGFSAAPCPLSVTDKEALAKVLEKTVTANCSGSVSVLPSPEPILNGTSPILLGESQDRPAAFGLNVFEGNSTSSRQSLVFTIAAGSVGGAAPPNGRQ